MKKTLLVGLLLFSLAGFCQDGAKIAFKNSIVDYGIISKPKDNGIGWFEFENTGNEPLTITSVNSTCGCAVLAKPDEPILPGKKGRISVKYNMTVGIIRKTVTVESNAINTEDGITKLSLRGEVVTN